MDLKELKQTIPYQWRVQSFSKFKPEASCVAYIDARDVMELLDKVCGPENWQSDYKSVDGQMFSGIGIRIDTVNVINVERSGGATSGIVEGGWVWKWDTGSESNIEKEKGQASDSFKRAAVKWGIGRFLYDLPVKKVATNEALGATNKPYVVDASGGRVWDISKHINSMGDKPVAKAPAAAPAAPAWKRPIKSAEQTLKEKKADIAAFLNAHPTVLTPLKDKEDFEEACLRITGIALKDENVEAILKFLTK